MLEQEYRTQMPCRQQQGRLGQNLLWLYSMRCKLGPFTCFDLPPLHPQKCSQSRAKAPLWLNYIELARKQFEISGIGKPGHRCFADSTRQPPRFAIEPQAGQRRAVKDVPVAISPVPAAPSSPPPALPPFLPSAPSLAPPFPTSHSFSCECR